MAESVTFLFLFAKLRYFQLLTKYFAYYFANKKKIFYNYFASMETKEQKQVAIAQRISELIDRMCISRRNFAQTADLDYSNLITILNGKRKVGGGIISKILIAYPTVNPDWLRHGEGEMFAKPTTSVNNATNTLVSIGDGNTNTYNGIPTPITTEEAGDVEEPEEVEAVPVVPRSIYTEPNVNILEYVQNNDVQMSPRIHQLSQYDLCYMVVNDEMSPYICAGDRIYLWAYPEGKERKIIDGRVYSVDTKLNGVLTRQLYKLENGFLAKSFNPRYADEVLEWEDIYRVYRIVGVLRMDE